MYIQVELMIQPTSKTTSDPLSCTRLMHATCFDLVVSITAISPTFRLVSSCKKGIIQAFSNTYRCMFRNQPKILSTCENETEQT